MMSVSAASGGSRTAGKCPPETAKKWAKTTTKNRHEETGGSSRAVEDVRCRQGFESGPPALQRVSAIVHLVRSAKAEI